MSEISLVSPAAVEGRRTFFRLAYGRNEGYVCLAFISQDKKHFSEEFFMWPAEEDALHAILEVRINDNVYFCPQLFDARKRTKEHVSRTPTAWADLDFCKPGHLLVEPTITLESSPGRYQALWVLEDEIDPDDAEDLSRRIAYKHADEGADRSGWDLTQLLRVPFTNNYKYMSAKKLPTVTIIGANKNRYRLEDFDEYPASPSYSKVDIPMPQLSYEDGEAEKLLQSKRMGLNPAVWRLFTEEPRETSWSEVLWKFLMLLYEAEFTREQVFIIAREAKCNKYARDRRPEVLLWKEVVRAEARADLHHKLLVPKPEQVASLLTEAERRTVELLPPSFVERYQTWASSLGDAAPQYHQAGAFVALSSLLAGNVHLPTSYGTIVPNLWFMILADTTLTRKTTAMDLAMDLVSEVDEDVLMATDGSIEGLLTTLSVRPGRPSVFLRDEFSGLLEQMTKKDYMAGMPELLTKLYDGKMQKRVLRKEVIEVRDPRLIIFAGGIKTRVTGALSYEEVASGFMPRFVFITALSDVSKVRPIGPPTQRTTGERNAILDELRDIQKAYTRMVPLTLKGTVIGERPLVTEAEMTEDAWIRYNELENTMLEMGVRAERSDIMTPIGDRLSKSILKAALLIAAANQRPEPDGTVCIQLTDILRAIKYGEQWLEHAKDIMENVGKGSHERALDTVRAAVLRNPNGISRSSLMQGYHLTARDATNMFETLEQRGLIKRQRVGKTEMLFPTSYGDKE